MKHLIYFFTAITILLVLAGCSTERTIHKGDKHLALGEYYDAAIQYRKAYRQLSPKQKELRGKVSLKMAQSYARINQPQRAGAAYANAIRYGQASTEDRLAYAQQLLKNASYKEAADIFRAILDSLPGSLFV